MSIYCIVHVLLKYDHENVMKIHYIPRNISFEFWDSLLNVISGFGNAGIVYSNFTIKALNDRILHNNVRIYNTSLSRLTSMSG